MVKLIFDKDNYIKFAAILMIAGLGLGIAGFALAGNKVENLKVKEKDIWYQTFHVNDKNQIKIYIKAGPVHIMSFGD